MLKPNFIKPKLNIEFFGKTRFWVGMVLGLVYAFLIYCFLVLINRGIGLFEFTISDSYSVINPLQTTFTHFLMAFASCLVGLYLFFEFTLFRNKKIGESNKTKLFLFHNIRTACWNTFFAGFAWVVTFQLVFLKSAFYIFDSYWVSLMISFSILVWLQFYIWSLFSFQFKNVFPIGLKTFIAFLLLSFIFSKYNPTPHLVDLNFQKVNLAHQKLKIDIPIFDKEHFPSKLVQRTLTNTIFVGDPEQDGVPNFSLAWGNEFKLDDLDIIMENFKVQVRERKRNLIIYSLVIDEKIKMEHVYQLFNELSKNQQLKISLAGLTASEINPSIFYNHVDQGLLSKIPFYCNENKKVVKYLKQNSDINIDFIHQIGDDFLECYGLRLLVDPSEARTKITLSANCSIAVEGEIIPKNGFYKKIKSIILEKKEEASFLFIVNPKTNYEDYFFFINELKKAYNQIRNEISIIRFSKEYEFLPKNLQHEIRADYPIIIFELRSEEERFIYNFFQEKK